MCMPKVYESLAEFLKMITPNSKVIIYTDGACSGNPGPGGWGAVLQTNGIEFDLLGAEPSTTNNRMEMLGAIESLSILPAACQIDLYTDSQYLKDGMTQWMPKWKINGWLTADKKPVKNKDLWQRLDSLTEQHVIQWHWVRGHNGQPYNERADALARKAIIAQRMAG